MGKILDKFNHWFPEDGSRYSVLLPDEAVANPALFEQQLSGRTPGQHRAQEVVELMRLADESALKDGSIIGRLIDPSQSTGFPPGPEYLYDRNALDVPAEAHDD